MNICKNTNTQHSDNMANCLFISQANIINRNPNMHIPKFYIHSFPVKLTTYTPRPPPNMCIIYSKLIIRLAVHACRYLLIHIYTIRVG